LKTRPILTMLHGTAALSLYFCSDAVFLIRIKVLKNDIYNYIILWKLNYSFEREFCEISLCDFNIQKRQETTTVQK
jgi:hypothetical protein